MNRIHRTALILGAAFAIALAGSAAAGQPADLHCPDGGVKVEANAETQDAINATVFPDGTVICVKAGKTNSGVIYANGINTLQDYAPDLKDVSYYVVYEEVTPSASPSASVEPSAEPSPTPSSTPSPSPSATPSATTSAEPSVTPSATASSPPASSSTPTPTPPAPHRTQPAETFMPHNPTATPRSNGTPIPTASPTDAGTPGATYPSVTPPPTDTQTTNYQRGEPLLLALAGLLGVLTSVVLLQRPAPRRRR